MDFVFELDIFGGLILILLQSLVLILFWIIIIFVRKLILKDKKINTALEIIKIIILIAAILVIGSFFKNRYFSKFEYANNIENIKICWDECVTVDVTTNEKNILENNLGKYTFGYAEEFLSAGWYINNSSMESRSAAIYINDSKILYSYIRSNNQEIIIIGFEKNESYYTKKGKNAVTEIFDKYLIQYQDTLTQS